MQFDRGYLSPYFINNQQGQSAELDKPLVLLVDKKISNIRECSPCWKPLAKGGRQLFDRRRGWSKARFGHAGRQHDARIVKVAAVKAPGFGDRRKAMLQDIAVLTAARSSRRSRLVRSKKRR